MYNLEQIFTIRNIIIYIIGINLFGLVLMLLDKFKAKNNMYRTAEKTLLTVSLIGGSVGTLIGMHLVRHKTKHPIFFFGIPIMLGIQVVIAVYCIIRFL